MKFMQTVDGLIQRNLVQAEIPKGLFCGHCIQKMLRKCKVASDPKKPENQKIAKDIDTAFGKTEIALNSKQVQEILRCQLYLF